MILFFKNHTTSVCDLRYYSVVAVFHDTMNVSANASATAVFFHDVNKQDYARVGLKMKIIRLLLHCLCSSLHRSLVEVKLCLLYLFSNFPNEKYATRVAFYMSSQMMVSNKAFFAGLAAFSASENYLNV